MAVGVEGARCGFLVVPETRGGTRGRTLRLAVARLPATGPNPAPDPVLFLHGGPGGSALSSARLHAGHPLRARREYILLDQRGVGASQPVLCPELGKRELAILAEDHAPGADEAPRLEAWLACRDELLAQGVDLGAYHSDASADDVADLRLALGIEQWNFFAISYGTKLALQILRRHPEGVRSAVLDSVYPPGVPAFESRTVDFARALDVLARRCREDSACARAYPDLERRGWAALAALEAQPLRVPVRPSEVLPASEFVVNPQDAAVTLHQLLYLRDAFPALPYLIDVLARRDAAAMTHLIEAMGPRAVAVNRAVNNTVECYERAPFASFEGYRRRSAGHPELLRWFTYFDVEFEACARWAEAKAPASENELVPRDVPLLVLAGEWDPITPPAWGRLVAERFPRATFQEFPGVGHGADRSHPCPRSAVVAFYDDPSRPPDLSCAASMAQPRFVTAVRRSPGVYRVAADVFGKPRPGLVAGLAVLALVLAVAGVGLLAAAIRGGGSTVSRVGRLAAALGSLLALGFLGGLALAVARTAESSALLLAFGLESKWSPLFALPWLAGASGLVAVLAAPAALRESGRAGRVLFDLALVAIAAFLVLWRGFRF